MSGGHYRLLIFLYFTFTTLPIVINSFIIYSGNEKTQEIERCVSIACKESLESISKAGIVFEDSAVREEVINNFYDSLAHNLTEETAFNQDLKFYVPCIALIDWNGYYISYIKEFKKSDGASYLTEVITPRESWSKIYGNYLVTYTLGNDITVSEAGKTIYSGNYVNAYEIFKDADNVNDPFGVFSSESSFTEEKFSVLSEQTSQQLNYFINRHNVYHNTYDTKYEFVMPRLTVDSSERIFEAPSIVAFFQGKQLQHTGGEYVSSYSLSASDTQHEYLYVIAADEHGDLYYHDTDCEKITSVIERQPLLWCAKKEIGPCPFCQ